MGVSADRNSPLLSGWQRAARIAIVAAPIIAWAVALLTFLVPETEGAPPHGGSQWPLLAIGALSTGAMVWILRKLRDGDASPQRVLALIALAALPWAAGALIGIAGAQDLLRPGSGGVVELLYSTVRPRIQGAQIAWGLLGSATFSLTVLGFLRRQRTSYLRDAVPMVLAILPVVIFGAVTGMENPLAGPVSLLSNTLTALIVLPFAGMALGGGNASRSATVPAIGAALSFALSFLAVASLVIGIATLQTVLATGAVAQLPTELVKQSSRELGALSRLSTIGGGLALLPAALLAWTAWRGNAERADLGRMLSTAGAIVLVVAGLDAWRARAARADFVKYSVRPSAPDEPPLEVPTLSDSAGADTLTGIPGGVVGGVVGGVPGGVVGGVPGEPGETTRPQVLSRVQPIFPAEKRGDRFGGQVILSVDIDSAGAVTGVSTLRGDPSFARAATIAVRQWRYRPSLQGGRPIATKGHVEIISFQP